MFGGSRRVARRTARRTSRRQMGMYGGGGGGTLYDDLGLPRMPGSYDDGYDEPARPAPAPQRQDTEVEEIAKLARLHEQGVLTDEEFSAKKKALLGL